MIDPKRLTDADKGRLVWIQYPNGRVPALIRAWSPRTGIVHVDSLGERLYLLGEWLYESEYGAI